MSASHALLRLARPHRVSLARAALLSALEAWLILAVPFVGGQLAASVLGLSEGSVTALLLSLSVLLLAATGLRILRERWVARMSERIHTDLRATLFERVQDWPLAEHRRRNKGDLLALLTFETEWVSGFITGPLVAVPAAILTSLGAAYMMIRLDPVLAIPIVLLVPVGALVLKLSGRRLRPLGDDIRRAYARTVSLAEEMLALLPVIKLARRKRIEAERYGAALKRHLDLWIRRSDHQSAVGPVLSLLGGLTVIWVLGFATSRSATPPQDMIVFLLYAALLTQPVARMADLWGEFQTARSVVARLDAALANAAEVDRGSRRPTGDAASIALTHISFGYEGRAPLFHDLNLEIAAGEIVALTGPNGAGKSTVVDLILRLSEPTTGSVLLNGRDAREYALDAYRSMFGVLPQSTMLPSTTIRDVIRYTAPEAGDKEVWAAAEAAQAAAFIRAQPDGLDTEIGDQGLRLSGGQRQRLALARALFGAPPVLILDEPTAMLDPEGESDFIRAARPVFHGRTVLLITHRPAALSLADRILRLDGGVFRAWDGPC